MDAVADLVSLPRSTGAAQPVSTEAELRTGLRNGKGALIFPELSRQCAKDATKPVLNADEKALLDMVRRGWSSRDIARQLDLSVEVVKLRLTQLYRRVGGGVR